ncbi:sigma factor-like helix-turn-helix DNA-binding protein [Nocardia aurantiaca]|uniref:sigma factor-like helix-turn-helix DNA-binding protein n=1 Tax=Nocardia aurantiaca TaxID=2675850 RepID=UPI0018AC0A3B|nr:sigma factor-like helix-turn-helix DNA-binding protein [Nocardia aurantiaca]
MSQDKQTDIESGTTADWLAAAWASVPERSRAVFIARYRGMTLQEIGDIHGFTREYARQILMRVAQHVCDRASEAVPDWRERLRETNTGIAIRRDELARVIGARDHAAVKILAEAAGLRAPRTWAGELDGWWGSSPEALAAYLSKIVDNAPFTSEMLEAFVFDHQVPDGFPIETLLADTRSPLACGPDGTWLRRRVRSRDAAYLWLLGQGAPHRIERIAAEVGAVSARTLAESLRRDERFVLIRPEGNWALAEWPGLSGTKYRGAVEVVVDLVTKFGPISKGELFSKAVQLYPVSQWRLQQCLAIDQLGETDGGQIDLVARGAKPIEVAEPRKPANMAMNDDGTVYGVRLSVDFDMLRGSGVIVNTWLTWQLGLRRAPMSMTFETDDLPVPLVVRRNTSGAQITALRTFTSSQGMAVGCEVAVVLLTDTRVARLHHACAAGACAAEWTEDPADREVVL